MEDYQSACNDPLETHMKLAKLKEEPIAEEQKFSYREVLGALTHFPPGPDQTLVLLIVTSQIATARNTRQLQKSPHISMKRRDLPLLAL